MALMIFQASINFHHFQSQSARLKSKILIQKLKTPFPQQIHALREHKQQGSINCFYSQANGWDTMPQADHGRNSQTPNPVFPTTFNSSVKRMAQLSDDLSQKKRTLNSL
ncbi:hypothetical protein HDU99_003067, partial [Rhizoclosmatium hyalinum]